MEQLNDGAFAEVDLLSATFDAGPEVGFDWLGQPLSAAEAPLAADGLIVLSHGYQISISSGSGRVTVTGP